MSYAIKLIISYLFLVVILLVPLSTHAFDVQFNDKEIAINADTMGNFGLSYPKLIMKGLDEQKISDPIEKRIERDKVFLKYNGGIQAQLEKSGCDITITFLNADNLLKFRMEMLIPFNFNDGGKWKVGSAEGKFPTEKPSKPQLFQGNADSIEITSDTGLTMSMKLPAYSFQQLQDNREWNWKIFQWMMIAVFNKDNPKSTLTVKSGSLDGSGTLRAGSMVKVDKFGQSIAKEFPGKVKSEDEFKKDVESEKEYYDSITAPKFGAYGGLPGSGSRLGLKKSSYFHVEKNGDKWILVDPDGDAFFHLGICTFMAGGEDSTYIEGREGIYEWLPPHDGEFATAWHPDKYWNPRAVSFYKANVIRKYGLPFSDEAHTKRLIERVKKFGFNSVGAFTGGQEIFQEVRFPYVSTLPLYLGEIPGVRGVFDPFDGGNLRKIDDVFSKSIPASTEQPLLIGYFLANEQAFEDLPRAVPALDGKHACKLKLVEMLKNKYREIAAFNNAWGGKADSFDALADQGLSVSSKAAFEDMQAFTELFLEAYYKTITETFRKYDRNHMLLGNRWQPGTANNESLCRIAGKYMDIISVNYYTDSVDTGFMKKIYDWSGRKPQMWSEFYYTAEKESNVGSRSDLLTQKERGQAYRYYIESAVALGFVIGTEWFTMIDQAVTGRFFEKVNGERANTGLFNVADRPYKACLAEMAAANNSIYKVWLDGKLPYVLDNPRFKVKGGNATRTVQAGRTLGVLKMDCKLDNWPGRPPERIGGDRLVVGRESDGTEAAFKACWDEKNLYLLVNVSDSTPMKNDHSGDGLWSADGLEIFIGSEKLDQGGAFLFSDRQILVGAGKASQVHVINMKPQPSIESYVVPSVDGKGYIIEIAIPWNVLSVVPKDGGEFLFDLGLDDSSDGKNRRCQLMWNGGARNSSDRGAWGKLKLVP